MRNHSYENDFDLHENETACRTHFHVKGFALRLVLKQRHKNLEMAYCAHAYHICRAWYNGSCITTAKPMKTLALNCMNQSSSFFMVMRNVLGMSCWTCWSYISNWRKQFVACMLVTELETGLSFKAVGWVNLWKSDYISRFSSLHRKTCARKFIVRRNNAFLI